jgi:4-carboxymuconolactone decarboxylase
MNTPQAPQLGDGNQAAPLDQQSFWDAASVAPALVRYTRDRIEGELWNRPGLSKRDRSMITIAVFIARNQTDALPLYVSQALDNGLKPSEISEIVTHLAYYSGWANAYGAVKAIEPVFAARGISADQLAEEMPKPLRLDEASEAKRATTVEANFGVVAPGVVKYTTDALFRDLWLRPGIAPRDRSLVTVSALIASGQSAQVTYHLNRAMENGLAQDEASEAMTQLAFYAGWPNVFTALPVVKDVFEKRPK